MRRKEKQKNDDAHRNKTVIIPVYFLFLFSIINKIPTIVLLTVSVALCSLYEIYISVCKSYIFLEINI